MESRTTVEFITQQLRATELTEKEGLDIISHVIMRIRKPQPASEDQRSDERSMHDKINDLLALGRQYLTEIRLENLTRRAKD